MPGLGLRSARVGIAIGALGVFLACFGPVLFADRQFGFRDAAHHYYPLYLRVQQEWSAGRVPLWDPWENGGMPLLGNPTAAVFYPGKLLFAVLPYAWGMRLYVSGHVLVAFLGMFLFLRRLGRTETASALGALGYAFGGPVLLLYNNVIYLVGAAWVPWCLRAVLGWCRDPRLADLAWMAVFLALQLLGGEPQAAYLTWLCGLGIAVAANGGRESESLGAATSLGGRRLLVGAAWFLGLLGACWVIAWVAPVLRSRVGLGPISISLERVVQIGVLGSVVFVGVRAWRRGAGWPRRVFPVFGAGLLAGALAAIQLLPAAENLASSTRAGDRFDRYGFSLLPYRVVELFAPGVLGQPYGENHAWRNVLPPANDPTFWVASLYLGGLTMVLALGALLLEPRSRGTRWLAAATAIALVASFGLYASPSGIGRWITALSGAIPAPRTMSRSLSEADFLAGDGSPYAALNLLVPGLGLFRYPSKMFTWFALGACTLAAFGWDRRADVGARRLLRLVLGLAAMAGLLFALVVVLRTSLIAWGERNGRPSQQSGPFQAGAAWLALRDALLHSVVLFTTFAAILRLRSARPGLAGALAVLLACADLALAHHALVWTVPQAVFDEPSKLLAELATDRGQAGPPMRIHRPAVWYPFGWFSVGSPGRIEALARWERQTLQPLHGLPENVAYTLTLGIMESPRYLALFRPWMLPVGPTLGPVLGLAPATQVLHFPRRAFDLWSTEYFLLPVDAAGWRDDSRGYASFLERTQLLAPEAGTLSDPSRRDAWRRDSDWRLVRNLSAYPRAWIVHQMQVIPNVEALDEPQRQARIRALLFENDTLWNDPDRPVIDLREVAWVESPDPARVRPRLEPLRSAVAESVEFRHFAPDRVELEATLETRGLVVLAEADASGWRVAIDGKPEHLWRTNLGMRGVVVPPGSHRLVFRYEPVSFRMGALLSGVAGCFIAGLLVRQSLGDGRRLIGFRRPRRG